MSDDVKKVEIGIVSTYDGKAAQQAAADQEKLTNTGKGLATTVPEMDTATKAYIITSEQEYQVIQKSAEALRSSIAVRAAAGLAVDDQVKHLAALDAALSTDRALTIADNIESKAAEAQKAQEKLVATMAQAINVNKMVAAQEEAKATQTLAYVINAQKAAEATAARIAAGQKLAETDIAEAQAALSAAEAHRAEAAAKMADTAATEEQILMSRKAITLFDEMSRGQRGQLTATLGGMLKPGGALAGQISLSELLPIAAMIAGIGMGINDWAKWLIKVNEEFQEVDKAADKSQESINAILAAGGNVNEEFVDMAEYIGKVNAQADSTAQMLRQMTLAAQEYDDAMDEAAANASATQSQQNDLDAARISMLEKSGVLTKAQGDEARAQLELKRKVQEIEAPAVKTQAEVAKTQGEITNAKKDAAKLPSQTDAKAATDAAKHKEERDAALIKNLPKAESALDKESAESTKVANDAINFKSDHAWYNPLNWFDHFAHAMFGNDTEAIAANAARQKAIAQDKVTLGVEAAKAQQNLPGDTAAATDAAAVQKKTETLAKTISDLSDHLERLNAKLAAQQKDEAGQVQTATQMAATAAAAGLFASGQTPDSIVTGVTAGNQTAIANMKTVLTALGTSNKDINAIISDLMAHVIDAHQEIASLKQRMAALNNTASQTNQFAGSAG